MERFRHDEPFLDDLEACVRWLQQRGIERIAFVGECFGARTALAGASLAGLEVLALLAVPVRYAEKSPMNEVPQPLVRHRRLVGYVSRAMKPDVIHALRDSRKRKWYVAAARAALRSAPAPRNSEQGPSWVSGTFLDQFEVAIKRKLPTLLLSGTGDPGFGDLQRSLPGRLGALIDGTGDRVAVEVLDGRIGACADADIQDETIETVVTWLVGQVSEGQVA